MAMSQPKMVPSVNQKHSRYQVPEKLSLYVWQMLWGLAGEIIDIIHSEKRK